MIRILDQETIQKISAGEVIHRPGNLIKELVENSIDAKASRVQVNIKNGGIDYVQVSDNGCGMTPEDMKLAVLPHSTSKLSSFSDLEVLTTMGFRGEALASIKAVCQLTVISKTNEQEIGQEHVYINNQLSEYTELGMNTGTVVRCENLFENIPVRKKFLKSSQAEGNYVTEIMYRLAIGNPHVEIQYVKDDKVIFQTNPKDGLRGNLARLFGNDYASNLLPFEIQNEHFSITGYISNSRYYRGNRSMQYIYVNHRYIQDDNIKSRIEECYQGLIPNGRFPAFQLFINLDASLIDVNIHPNKEKIKFSFDHKLFNVLKEEINSLLYEKHAVPNMIQENVKKHKKGIMNLSDYIEKYNQNSIKSNSDINTIPSVYEKENLKYEVKNNVQTEPSKSIRFNFDLTTTKEESSNYYETFLKNRENYLEQENKKKKKEFFDSLQIIGVVFDTYIVCQQRNPQKLVFIDQHAAHERIMYEKYCFQYKNKSVDSQLLLTPMILNLKQDEFELCLSRQEMFKNLGYDLREFGPQSIAVNAVPMILGYPKGEGMILDLIDSFKTAVSIDPGFVESKIISMSCKSAVKGGNVLGKLELNSLIEQMGRADNPYTCPHGRPTLVELTQSDLEKIFLRNK